jgi:hypothetical protein
MKGRVDEVGRKSTRYLFRSVVLRSPVDTGRFRANWNVSFGAPDYTTTPSIDQARGLSEADRALHIPLGGVVCLSNGLPYARRLEHGWSRQAPTGMVRLSVVRFGEFVRQAVAA